MVIRSHEAAVKQLRRRTGGESEMTEGQRGW